MEAYAYTLSLSKPYEWAKGKQTERRGLLIHFEGHWGEVAPPPHAVPPHEVLLDRFRHLMEGLDPYENGFLSNLNKRNPNPRLRCGIATAWHSWRGTSWGDQADRVPVNGLITGDEIEPQVEGWLGQGVTTLKVKLLGRGDIERVRRVREAAGRAVRLRLDANERLADPLEAFAPFDIEYIEQPLPKENREGLIALQQKQSIPIALDESATDAETIADLLKAGAGEVVILKPQRLGGPDRTIEAMRVAIGLGAKVVVTNSLETAVGVNAALKIASYLPEPMPACGIATSNYLAEDVAELPKIEQGCLPVTPIEISHVDPLVSNGVI